MSNQLTDEEKKLLAHVMFCYTAGLGYDSKRLEVVDLVHKLGVLKEYSRFAYEVVKAFEEKFGPQKEKTDE